MKDLELLAPARNADIGIAAIDCGADAVYIAGPHFGARQAAGNDISEIRRLCGYAAKFGARVFVTVNTIIYEDELPQAKEMIRQTVEAGVDALIVQDLAVIRLVEELVAEGMRKITLHASTQSAILNPERAEFLASLGYARLILERELSLAQIREIASAAPQCEIEFFVHGALCVCYSGQCYMSEAISGRSANRGACIQACRSRYDLVDAAGKVLVKDKALLSLKDYNLRNRLSDLAEAGVSSFKIEGRLKNESYVRNVVRDYSLALDQIVAAHPDRYRRASFGKVTKSFAPALDKTFNRGYTELYIDGVKGKWASMDAAKGMGEEIGKIISVKQDLRRGSAVIEVECPAACKLNNGDGFSFVAGTGDVIGFRGDICENLHKSARIICKPCEYLYKGAKIFRNLDSAFEKEIMRNPGTRMMGVGLDVSVEMDRIQVAAVTEDGRRVEKDFMTAATEQATNTERLESMVRSQLTKNSGIYEFSVSSLEFLDYPMVSSAFLNSIRRSLSEALEQVPVNARALAEGSRAVNIPQCAKSSYKNNIANHIAAQTYLEAGAAGIEDAYELAHQKGAELMRTRYCIRHELGICPKQGAAPKAMQPLFLLNNGRRFALGFDCRNCEMTVSEA